METYLYKFSACLLVFWLIYALFLEREKMHQLKRFYLLGAVVLALVIPLLTITYYVEPVVTDFDISQAFTPIESSYIAITEETPGFWDLEKILWLVYGLGVLLFSTRFIINLVKMYKRISDHTKVSERSFIYVFLQELRIPHSFFNYIFLNQSKYEADAIPKEVILHEETHAKQLHSIDILVIELLQIVFWFHPLIYILKHHIKLNHEFLADQAVLQEGVDTRTYQNILLQFSSNTDEYQLSSAINYSSIKKRFTVMKTQTSKTRIWLSSSLLLPIIAILFYSFAEKEYVEKDKTDILQNVKDELQKAEAYEIQYLGSGASEKLMQEYKGFIKEYTDTNTIFGSKYERAIIIYDQLMSDQQRSTVEKYPKRFIPEPNLSKTRPRKLSSAQYEAFKNAEQYAIWIDGKYVSNSILSNYSVNDFVHYSGSIVQKNAHSEKFPQPNQYHLYTKVGFKVAYQDSQLNRYKKATAKYSNAIYVYLKGSQADNSELKILKAQAHKIYKTFTAEELKKYTILPSPPVPAQKSYAAVQKPVMWILINRNNQLLVDNELGTLESIENKLKKLTKEGKTGQLVSIKYDKETSKNIILKVERLVKLNKFKLASFDVSKIPPPPPSKKTKGGPNHEDTQDIYNPSFLEYIIEMENEGASFYLDDEKISAKKAKSIATNNKGKRTEMITQKGADGNYIVKLSSATTNNRYARSIDLKILKNGTYLIDGIKATKRTFNDVCNQLHQDITPEIRNNIMNIHVTSSKKISNEETWFIYNALQDYGFYRIVTPNQEINRAKGNTPFAIESSFSIQQKATAKQVSEYNAWAKKINNQDEGMQIIHKKDLAKYKRIYSIMSNAQRKNAESFPKLPPPPPAPEKAKDKSGPIEINGATYYFSQEKGETTYYDKYGKVVDINKIPPPPPIPNNITPEQKAKMKKATDAYMKANPDKVGKAKGENGEVFDVVEVPVDLQGSIDINGETFYYTTSNGKTKYFNRYGKEVKMDNLPPPPPAPPEESTLDFVIRMAKANAKFFYKLKPITSDKAISLLKKNDKLHINAQKTNTKEPLVYISNKPIYIGVKGKSKN